MQRLNHTSRIATLPKRIDGSEEAWSALFS
jgi:hypothetical protein